MRGSIVWVLPHSEVLDNSSKPLMAVCMHCSIVMSIEFSGVLEGEMWDERAKMRHHLTCYMHAKVNNLADPPPLVVHATVLSFFRVQRSQIIAINIPWT